jgi:hypothetical protein
VADRNRSIPTLDGWRGFAVIAVILYHGRFGFFGEDSELTKLSAHGFLGVDLFFAISACLGRYLLELPMIRLGNRLSANVPGPGLSRPAAPTVAMGAV